MLPVLNVAAIRRRKVLAGRSLKNNYDVGRAIMYLMVGFNLIRLREDEMLTSTEV